MESDETVPCQGPGGCGHPNGEHTRKVGEFRAACTHPLSKSGDRATCACLRFKGVRVVSPGSRTIVATSRG